MRDYIGELLNAGLKITDIAKESGISVRKLNNILAGNVKLTSKIPEYEKIRNTSRRVSYKIAKELGGSQEEINQSRRRMLTDQDTTRLTTKQRIIRTSKYNQKKMYQLYLVGLFEQEETKERRVQTGLSKAYKKKRHKIQLDEAVNYARAKLEGSNWILIKIIHQKYTEYYLL